MSRRNIAKRRRGPKKTVKGRNDRGRSIGRSYPTAVRRVTLFDVTVCYQRMLHDQSSDRYHVWIEGTNREKARWAPTEGEALLVALAMAAAAGGILPEDFPDLA